MSPFGKMLFVVLPFLVLAGIPRGNAQTQTSVKVADKDYTVTEFPGGARHMVQLAGPEGQAMVMVAKDKITAYVSPPGGGTFKPLIDQVWAAYQAQKGNNTSQATPDDPNAARRAAQLAAADAQAAQALGRVRSVNGGGDEKPVFKAFTDAGAIVTHAKFGDVTVSDNGMKYEWTVNPVDPRTGQKGVPSVYTVSFEGGDKEAGAGAKTGKFMKGLGAGIITSENHNANATTNITGSTDVWKVDEQHGKIKQRVFESGGMQTGGTIAYNGRNAMGDQGQADLNVVRVIWSVVAEQINAARANNQPVPFNTTTDRFQRGMNSLEKATSKFESK